MQVASLDRRPASLLRPRYLDVRATLGGLAAVLLVYASLFGVALLAVGGAGSEGSELSPPEPEPAEMNFIPTKLVKLGRTFEPRELPNRIRRARSTAQTPLAQTPTKSRRRVRRVDAGVAPADAVEDLLNRIGTAADREAAIARAAAQEGDPGGVAEGTATRDEGDLYRSQLYAFFRRGFAMPTSVPEEERKGLRSVVRVTTSPDGRIVSFEASPSGNPDFDRAVRLRLDQAVGSMLPPPPEPLRAEFYGNAFPISMRAPR